MICSITRLELDKQDQVTVVSLACVFKPDSLDSVHNVEHGVFPLTPFAPLPLIGKRGEPCSAKTPR
jgi:hypothetical protein